MPALATVDVSFISLAKVLPAVAACLAPDGELLALVKPQFELGRGRVGQGRGRPRRGGPARRAASAAGAATAERGSRVRGFASSGLPGPEGQPRDLHPRAPPAAEALGDVEAAIAEVEP